MSEVYPHPPGAKGVLTSTCCCPPPGAPPPWHLLHHRSHPEDEKLGVKISILHVPPPVDGKDNIITL